MPALAVAVAAATLAVAAPPDADAGSGTIGQCYRLGTSEIDSIQFRSPNGTYKIGETIDIRVTSISTRSFDTGTSGSPSARHILEHTKIKLDTGGESDGFASFVSAPNFGRWVDYRYTVRAGDDSGDLDYDSRRALYWRLTGHGQYDHDVVATNSFSFQCLLPTPEGPGSLSAQADIGIDGIVPRVANVTLSPPDRGYNLDSRIEFDVNFDDTVVYSGVAPVLLLNLSSGETRNASYTGGNNTDRLTFAYEVKSGDDASNVEYNGTMALTTAGSMTDKAGNAANLTLSASGSLGRSGPIPIDATRPTVLNVTLSPPDRGYNLDSRIEFDVNFDDTVVYSGVAPVLLLNLSSGETRNASYTGGNNTDRLTFAYEVKSGDDASNVEYNGTMALTTAGSMTDKAGNAANLTLSASGSLGRSGPIPIDATRPTVLDVSSPNGTGPHTEGSTIVLRASFSENVRVDTTGGTPRIALNTGADGRYANYDEAPSTARTLTFSYMVRANDETLDLEYTNGTALSRNGGTIRDEADNDAVLTLTDPDEAGPLGTLGPIRLDAKRPTVESVSSTTPGGTYGIDSRIAVTVAFSEDVVVDETGGTPRIALNTGAPVRHALYDAAASTNSTLAFSYNVTEGDVSADLDYANDTALSENGGIIEDTAGHRADLELRDPGGDGLLGPSGTIRIDGIYPRVESVFTTADAGSYPINSVIDVRVRFSEPVAVYSSGGSPYVLLDTGPTDRRADLDAGANNSDTLAFSYTVQANDEVEDLNYRDERSLRLGGGAIRDAGGNDANLTLPATADQRSLGGLKDVAVYAEPPAVVSAEAEFLDRIRVTFDGPVASGALSASAGWSVSGPSAEGLSVAALGPVPLSAPLTEIVLALDGPLPDTAPDIALSYNASAGGIRDEDGTWLRDRTGIGVADRIRPVVSDALITGNREITIDYTEPVRASQGAYSGLEIDGAARQLDPYDTDATALRQHVIGFAGAPAPVPEPPGSMAIDGTAVLDESDPPNPLGDGALDVDIRDGRILDVFSSRITGPDTAVVAYTRGAAAQLDAYSSLVVGGQDRDITGLEGGGGAGSHFHTLTFSPGGAPPNATGSVVIDGMAVLEAESGMALGGGAIERTLADGQPPSVLGATAVSPGAIRVSFSEPVAAPGTGAGGWSVSGRDAAGLAVASSTDAAEPSDTLELALEGELPDTAPDAVTLSYHPADGSVEDAAGNGLVASSTSVGDGMAPEIRSAFVAGPNAAEVRYTEPVWAAPGAYASIALSSGGGPRTVAGLEGNGTVVHTVAFGGDPAEPGTTGTLEMDETAVLDAAMLPLGADTGRLLRLAGEAPTDRQGNATARAAFTAGNTVTITYSEALGPPAGHVGPVYAAVAIDGEGASAGSRPVSGAEGLGTAVHTVAFGGDGVGRNQTGTITLAVGLEGAGSSGSGDAPRFAAGAIPVASGRTVQTVLIAQAQQPPVSIEPDGFTRAVDGAAAGEAARLAINVTGLAGAPGAPGAATFPAEAVTLTASFGTVTFPPGVTAEPVPASGALYLYVDDDTPFAGNATSALGYPGSGGMILRTIVEAGSDQTPVMFDRPVRVSLEGQAGGRAFYIDGGPSGKIVPIDLACAADDTERVHRQLNGMGECRIESGSDMVIHTYHLTRFGTAASERGTPPPVDHTCSMRLGEGRLDAQARPGGYSDAAEQAVVNSGSLPFSSVELEATPWSVTPLAGAPVQNATSSPLPANTTLMSTAGSDAGFAPLPAGAVATAVARGLGGGLEAPLWFMLNLTGHAQVEGAELAQSVTYTAECAGAR